MKFICYSAYAEKDIGSKLGVPEYSYYFVLQKFLPLLKQMGEVVLVDKPAQQVDEIYLQARQQNMPCVFLSFTAPQNTLIELDCPTICVFAWEFDSIPDEVFEADSRSNWLTVFNNITGIITHSSFTTAVLQQRLESDYPMLSLPAPVWDSHHGFASDSFTLNTSQEIILRVNCPIIDTEAIDLQLVEDTLYPEVKQPYPGSAQKKPSFLAALGRLGRGIYRDCLSRHNSNNSQTLTADTSISAPDLVFSEAVSTNISSRNPKVDPLAPLLKHYTDSSVSELRLKGVIYTSVLNPNDGRKNWHDMICGFCIAFKNEANATLIIKLVQRDAANMLLDLIHRLYQLTPMQCRVVIIDGFLDNTAYSQLIKASHYVLNTAHGEGQCLPLMEFMSAGIPAVAPDHSALGDYIDDSVAFVIQSHKEAALFPHDPRAAYRTHRFRINWQSLREALENSFTTITQQPERYRQMALTAQQQLRGHCSLEVSQKKLQGFLESTPIQTAIHKPAPDGLAESIDKHRELRSWLNRCEELAQADGWLHTQSRSIFKRFPIEAGDIVADLGCSVPEASQFCANLGVHTRLFGQDREHLSKLVKALHDKQAPRFRAYWSEADNQLPQHSSSLDKVMILNLLQRKSDPLAFLKEAVRVGKPGCLYLITVPAIDGSPHNALADRVYPTAAEHHKFSAADFQHLVTVAGLEIQHQSSPGLYWLLRAMLYSDHNNHSLNASYETIASLLLENGIDLKQENIKALESAAAHLIIARKAVS